MTKIYTRVGKIYKVAFALNLLLLLAVVLFGVIFEPSNWFSNILLILISVLTIGLFYAIPKTTYYLFEEKELFCKSFFMKKRIPYSAIRKIEKTKSIHHSTTKFTADFYGLAIFYNKFDDVFVSPKDEESFILTLEQKCGKDLFFQK